jgi:ABC-2 type transport system permease protein
LLTLAMSALALCFGTVYPQFESENAAQIPTSFGGLVYMMTAITILGLVIGLEARPVYTYLSAMRLRGGATAGDWRELVFGFAMAGLVCVVSTVVPIGIAVRRLEAVERG